MTKLRFPAGVRAAAKPKFSDHGGRTWDCCDVTLPNGREVLGRQETTWSNYFYFEHDGRWYKAPWFDFGVGRGSQLRYDLRDQAALKAFESGLLEEYEAALRGGKPSGEIEKLTNAVEDEAVRIGYNNHRRLAALHTWAERLGLAEEA